MNSTDLIKEMVCRTTELRPMLEIPGASGVLYGLDGEIYGMWPAMRVESHICSLVGYGERLEGVPDDAGAVFLSPKAARKVASAMKEGVTHLQEVGGICMKRQNCLYYLQTGGLEREETLDVRIRAIARNAENPYVFSSKAAVNLHLVLWYRNSVRHDVFRLAGDACSMIDASKVDAVMDEKLDSCVVYAKEGFLFDAVSGIILRADDEGNVVDLCAVERYVPGMYNVDHLPPDNRSVEKKNILRDKCLDFVRKMRMMIRAGNSPLKTVDGIATPEGRTSVGREEEAGSLRYRTVYLSDRYRSLVRRRYSRSELDRNGKRLSTVFVSGFVRQQPYGPGGSLRREIWVDGFTRGQWVNSGLTMITVK